MKLLLVIALTFVLSGCIATYRDFPVEAIGKKPAAGSCETLQYKINRFNILDMGGYNRLQEVFSDARICRKMLQVNALPEKGLYLEVATEWKPLTLPALVCGYISVSTLTILPAWSTQDGYIVRYNLYLDGQIKETYQYNITRKGGIWLGLLPFSWINLFTYKEADVFAATAYQFSADAQAYFGPQLSWPVAQP